MSAGVFVIAWKTLRRQPGALLGAFLMIIIGASLISAFSLIQHSAVNAVAPVERYQAVPVVAGGTEGCSPRTRSIASGALRPFRKSCRSSRSPRSY